MLYAFLISHDPALREALDEEGRQELARRYISFRDYLRDRGFLRDAQRLARPEEVFQVRLRRDGTLVEDSAVAPAPERPAGLLVVECSDEAQALELAARTPGVEIGSVEVRPVWPLSQELS